MNRWPSCPQPPPPFKEAYDTCHYWPPTPEPMRAKCKHGDGDCEDCGTTDRRDVNHTTRGGVGVVGALRRDK